MAQAHVPSVGILVVRDGAADNDTRGEDKRPADMEVDYHGEQLDQLVRVVDAHGAHTQPFFLLLGKCLLLQLDTEATLARSSFRVRSLLGNEKRWSSSQSMGPIARARCQTLVWR